MIYTQEEAIRDMAIGSDSHNVNMKSKEFKLIKIHSFTKDLILATFTINGEMMAINYTGDRSNKLYQIFSEQFNKA